MLINVKNEKGFTFIEVLITSGVVLFALYALIALAINLINSNATNERMINATNMGRDKMEDLKDDEFDLLANGTASNTTEGVSYSLSWTITNLATNLKDIAVNVTWTDNNGSHTVSLVTRRSLYY